MEKYTVERVDSPESDLEAEDIVKPVSLIKLVSSAVQFTKAGRLAIAITH